MTPRGRRTSEKAAGPLARMPPSEGGTVHNRDVGGGTVLQQGLGRTVEQGPPVVSQHHLKASRGNETTQEPHRAAGYTNVADQPLGYQLAKCGDRAIGGHGLLEADPLGVMQVEQGKMVEPETVHALSGRGQYPAPRRKAHPPRDPLWWPRAGPPVRPPARPGAVPRRSSDRP